MGTLFIDYGSLTNRTGTSGRDTINGTAASEYIDGLGGADAISAGAGNDFIVYDPNDSRIDGGAGFDTLLFNGVAQALKLSSKVVTGIEQISLGGGGRHALQLAAADLIRVSDTDVLTVWGDRSSTVDIGKGWSFVRFDTIDTTQFAVYQNSGATLRTQFDLFVIGYSLNATINSSGATSVTEDTSLTASGTITVSDPNAGQNFLLLPSAAISTSFGSVTLQQAQLASGVRTYTYTYTVDNAAIQFLGLNKTATDSFTVTSFDGTTRTINLVLNGVNDPAVIGNPSNRTVTEDSNVQAGNLLVANGTIPISDKDANEAGFISKIYTSGACTLDLKANGDYTFSADNGAFQSLNGNAATLIAFTISAIDGTQKMVSFNVNGTNDLAAFTGLAGGSSTSVSEDGKLGAAGKLLFTDADSGESGVRSSDSPVAGIYGSLSLAADGSYTYELNNFDPKVQSLTNGAVASDSFVIESTDGTASTVLSFTIAGQNDPASFNGLAPASSTSVGEDATLTATGKLVVIDIDSGEMGVQTDGSPYAGVYGSLLLMADGSYTYTLANESSIVQALAGGATVSDSFAILTMDGSASTQLRFEIAGLEDPAIIGDPDDAYIMQQTQAGVTVVRSGKLPIFDFDTDSNFFIPQSGWGSGQNDGKSFGTFSLDADGYYEYKLNNDDVRYLMAGVSVEDQFTVTSIDGTTKTIWFVINGVNDLPVIGPPSVSSVTEDSDVKPDNTLVAAGSIPIFDPDSYQGGFKYGIFSTSISTFVINPDGSYVYTVDNAKIQYLGAGASETQHFTIRSLDNTEKVISFTIYGANEPATFSAYDTYLLYQKADLNVNTITVTDFGTVFDTDGPYTAVSVTPAAGNLGAIVIDKIDNQIPGTSYNYQFTYTVSNDEIRYLNAGDHVIDVFTFTSADGSASKTVTFVLEGVNDPTVINDLPANVAGVSAVTEDVNVFSVGLKNVVSASGKLTYSDPDQGQTNAGLNAMTNATGWNSLGGSSLGTLTMGADGTYTYEVSNDRIQFLHGGQTVMDYFTVTAVDGATKTISFTLNGATDAGLDFTGDTVKTTLYGSDGNDIIKGTFIAETLYGYDGNDDLAGVGNNNTVYGGAGDDTLRGGSGTDKLHGGSGNDVYFVGTGDLVFEDLGGGIDTVFALSNFTLPDHVENLTVPVHLTIPVITGTGNALDNMIDGSAGNEILYGMGGNDTISGNGGTDSLYGGAGDDSLIFASGQSGNGFGGDGNDTFTFSRTCNVTLEGGAGSDTFIVRNSNSLVGGNSKITDFSVVAFTSGGDRLDLPFNPALCKYIPGADNVVHVYDPNEETLLVTLVGTDFDVTKISTYITNGNLM